ncbi:MAG TPA: hypothetical protein VI434_04205 [Candidatus Dormibacteraeota bacterium]
MTTNDDPVVTSTPPEPQGDETDPDKDSGATPTDHAVDPENADLNAGALSQPTSPDES